MNGKRLWLFGGALHLVLLVLFCLTTTAFADDTWMSETDSAEQLTAPFRRTMYAGELFRLSVPKGRAIRLTLGDGSAKAIVMLIPMKEGKRTGPKEILKDEPLYLLHSAAEADYFAMKVFTGMANVDAEVAMLDEITIEEGKKETIPLVPFRQTTGRFVNLSDFRSTASYTFLAGDEDISKSSDWDRTVNLEFKGSSMTKTWKTPADKIIVEAVRGRVLVKIGHPFEKLK